MLISGVIIGAVLQVRHFNQEKNTAFLFDKIPAVEIDYNQMQKTEIRYDTDYVSDIGEEQKKAIENETKAQEAEEIRKRKEQEQAYFNGLKEKELSTFAGIDDAVMLVNGEVITRRYIERSKIATREFQRCDSFLKRDIILIVRKLVVNQTATQQGMTISQEEVDAFVREQKLAQTNGIIANYIKGMGISEEEYWKTFGQNAYTILQRAALKESILSPRKDKFIAEADERKTTVPAVETEYWEKYVDSLILKSSIEILDPELKELFGIGEK